MIFRIYSRKLACITALVVTSSLGACTSDTQTTSGQDYLARYATESGGQPGAEIDDIIREAASVEPVLRFPARIGIARIEYGEFTGLPEDEAEAWMVLAEKLGTDFGEFVPVSRLVAELAFRPEGEARNSYWRPSMRQLIQKIRVGAARQHLDAVLIYQVYGTKESRKNGLALSELTIIGAFVLPTRSINVVGYAEALLVDVRNGYPYGTASTEVDKERYSTVIGDQGRAKKHEEHAKLLAVQDLASEVATMVRTLDAELVALDAVK